MESRIIIDENKNAFALNGTKLEPLGEANELKNIWQQKVFKIGKNLYFKKENDIFLLAENIDSTYEIKIDDFAWKQFELVGDVLVMVDTDMDGIKKFFSGRGCSRSCRDYIDSGSFDRTGDYF